MALSRLIVAYFGRAEILELPLWTGILEILAGNPSVIYIPSMPESAAYAH